MSNKKKFQRIRYLKDNIKFNSLSGNKANMFQYCKNNTQTHEFKKFCVFVELINKNCEVFTEVEFKNKKRADIVAFDNNGNGYIYEIVNSESEKSISNKINTYPIDFELFFIKVNDLIELTI